MRSRAGWVTSTPRSLDWVQSRDLTREQLRNMLLAAFGGAMLAAQQADPKIELQLF